MLWDPPGVPGVRFIHVLTNKYYNVWKSVMLLRVLLIVKVLVLWGGILGEVPSGSKSVGFTKQKYWFYRGVMKMTHVDLPKQNNACVLVLHSRNNAFMKGVKPRSTKMWVLQSKSDGFVKGEPPWNTIWYPKCWFYSVKVMIYGGGVPPWLELRVHGGRRDVY